MKNTLTLIFILSISSILFSQYDARWYSLESTSVSNFLPWSSRYISDSDTSLFTSFPDNLTDIKVSGFTLSYDLNLKNKIYGLRANRFGNEVLIIDSDMDKDFKDEKVIELPTLALKKDIDYNTFYVYPTDSYYIFDTEYEMIKDSCILTIPVKLAIRVYSKFDSLSNSLYYLDKFKIGYGTKFEYNGILDNENILLTFLNITASDKNDDINYTLFIHKNGIKRKLYRNIDFKINLDGATFQIDSFDFINRRLLIKKKTSYNNYINISGVSLFDSTTISTVSEDSPPLKLIHVWGPWCAGCVANIPKLIELKDSFPNVKFIGVCISDNKKWAVIKAEKKGMDWDNIFFTFEEFKKQKITVKSYPTYFLVDQDNKVLGRYSGIENVKKGLIYLSKQIQK